MRHRWRCHAYCLLGNHYHLLVETLEASLSEGMRRLNGVYAQWFNRKHEVGGHLFQGRFHSVLVESPWHLLELSRYIVLNPVGAGLCGHPREWRWSSYRGTEGSEAPLPLLTVDWLLGQFGRRSEQAREAFRAFVEDAPDRTRRPSAA